MPTSILRRLLPTMMGLLAATSVLTARAPASAARPAQRAPSQNSLQEQLQTQNDEAHPLIEAWMQKQLELARTRRAHAGLRARLGGVRAQRAKLQLQVDRVGAGVYISGPGSTIAVVLDTEDPARALHGMEILVMYAQRTDDLLAQYHAATTANEVLEAELARKERELNAQFAELDQRKAKVEGAIRRTRTLLAQLQLEEQAPRPTPATDAEVGSPSSPAEAGPAPQVSGGGGSTVSSPPPQASNSNCGGSSCGNLEQAATDAARAARAAGFAGDLLVTMVAIAGAESTYRPWVIGPNGDYGEWQIKQRVWSRVCPGDLLDLDVNARCAKLVHGEQGLEAWNTYTSGAYKPFMDLARRAVTASG